MISLFLVEPRRCIQMGQNSKASTLLRSIQIHGKDMHKRTASVDGSPNARGYVTTGMNSLSTKIQVFSCSIDLDSTQMIIFESTHQRSLKPDAHWP